MISETQICLFCLTIRNAEFTQNEGYHERQLVNSEEKKRRRFLVESVICFS